jgi:hypothetical protein
MVSRRLGSLKQELGQLSTSAAEAVKMQVNPMAATALRQQQQNTGPSSSSMMDSGIALSTYSSTTSDQSSSSDLTAFGGVFTDV